MSLIGLPISKGMLVGLAILAVIAAAEGGVIVGQAKKIGALSMQVQTSQHALSQSELFLRGCQETKTLLFDANEACLAEIRVGKTESDNAQQTIDTLTTTLAERSKDVHRERETIYRLPECEELAKLDLAKSCPGIAGSLRRRAADVSAPRTD